MKTYLTVREVEAYMADMEKQENRRQALEHAVRVMGPSTAPADAFIEMATRFEQYLNGVPHLAPRRKPRKDKKR